MLLALGFLPLAHWIPGGRSIPWLGRLWSTWANGALIVAGVTLIAIIAARRVPVLSTWHPLLAVERSWDVRPRLWGVGLPLASLAVYLAIALFVFDGRPLFIDEIVQLLQARIFAEGSLVRPVDPDPAFRSILLVADVNGRYFAQFPAGGPAIHVAGWAMGASWVTVPLLGAIAVLAFVHWLRIREEPADAAPWAVLLFALSPFWAFMAGSHMNHVPASLALILAVVALTRLTASGASRRMGAAFGTGLALGVAATVRPVDAFAFAVPAALWIVWRARHLARPRVAEAAAALAGVAVPLALLFWVNDRTTGEPLLFGYDLLWGRGHGLGFHDAPWGMAHTPLRGLELLNLYALGLQEHLFETPFPSLLPAIAALALWPRVDAGDRYLLAASALVLMLYGAYWHYGQYLGPRFLIALTPVIALWSARSGRALKLNGRQRLHRIWVVAMAAGAAVAIILAIPQRARGYASSEAPLRWDADSAARVAGVRRGLVFVRESWGAELIARMWALGVDRPATEFVYTSVDACRIEQRLSELERSTVRGAAARDSLLRLVRPDAVVFSSPFSPDQSERFEPGTEYVAECRRQVEEDRAGFTVLAPLLLARYGDNVYVRDLGIRDTAALRSFPGRRPWLLKPDRPGTDPRFLEVR